MSPIAIFSGSAHPALAEEICAKLGVPLLPTKLKRDNAKSVSALLELEQMVQDNTKSALRA